MIRAKKLGRPQLWRRPTIDESTTPIWLLVIASEANQSTVPLPPAHRLGHASSPRRESLELVGGPSLREVDGFAALAMTGSERGNGNVRRLRLLPPPNFEEKTAKSGAPI
jgi:hypothetical protein